MSDSISPELAQFISAEIARQLQVIRDKDSNDISREIDKRFSENNNQLVVANNNQLNQMKEATREIVLAVGNQIEASVYEKVVGEINENIVPQVNNMVEYVNYKLQDGGEVVDGYRRAVEHQANKIDPNVRLLTYGKTDKRIISDHIRTFFEDESTSESSD